jgi:hypothetical protein
VVCENRLYESRPKKRDRDSGSVSMFARVNDSRRLCVLLLDADEVGGVT